MLAVEDWAEIRRLHFGEKLSIKEIARRLGVASTTTRMASTDSVTRVGEREHSVWINAIIGWLRVGSRRVDKSSRRNKA